MNGFDYNNMSMNSGIPPPGTKSTLDDYLRSMQQQQHLQQQQQGKNNAGNNKGSYPGRPPYYPGYPMMHPNDPNYVMMPATRTDPSANTGASAYRRVGSAGSSVSSSSGGGSQNQRNTTSRGRVPTGYPPLYGDSMQQYYMNHIHNDGGRGAFVGPGGYPLGGAGGADIGAYNALMSATANGMYNVGSGHPHMIQMGVSNGENTNTAPSSSLTTATTAANPSSAPSATTKVVGDDVSTDNNSNSGPASAVTSTERVTTMSGKDDAEGDNGADSGAQGHSAAAEALMRLLNN
mmetsp:Transcript_79580/g.156127  ORF Transcript_79580/g.156127 Transcript_79580/m.156127 type:complete len:291 (+) Transcript_79580:2-874(+)